MDKLLQEFVEALHKCTCDDLAKAKKQRCWDGYEPTPGKKPYSEDSCRPIKKDEDEDEEELEKHSISFEFFDNGDLEIEAGELVPEAALESIYSVLEKKEWSPKKEHKSKSGGLTQAGVDSYKRANPGSKLQTAVTEKAPKGKRAKRRKSFCARNKGQIEMHNIDCRKDPKKRACLARKKWRCKN